MLTKPVTGRLAITNYDPRSLSNEERTELNARAAVYPMHAVFVDIRPDDPGGDLPLRGTVRLRSLNAILTFVAAGIAQSPEYDVPSDCRTGRVSRNPRRALGIDVASTPSGEYVPRVFYEGQYYYVSSTGWNLEAFRILYQLFQMSVTTDLSKVGVPSITIVK